jgi:hypothetical protein
MRPLTVTYRLGYGKFRHANSPNSSTAALSYALAAEASSLNSPSQVVLPLNVMVTAHLRQWGTHVTPLNFDRLSRRRRLLREF